MKNKDLFKKLKNESIDFIPNIKEKVFSNIGISPNEKVKQPFFKYRYKLGLSFVLLFLILLISIVSFTPKAYSKSYVLIDINPSFELILDDEDNIEEINPLNPDALLLLNDMNINLKGKTVQNAIMEVVNASTVNGYLDKNDEESVVRVISVNKNKEKENKLKQKIEVNIKNAFSNNNIHSILKTSDPLLEKTAKENKITLGQMVLINKALELDKSLDLKKALKMDIENIAKIANDKSREKLKEFEDSYDSSLAPLEDSKNEAISKLEDFYSNIFETLDDIEEMIDNRKPLHTIKKDLQKLFKQIPNFEGEANVKTYSEAQTLVNRIKDSLNSDLDFYKDIINDKYNLQKDAYRIKVKDDLKQNDSYKFDFEFDKDFEVKDNYKKQNNKEEQQITMLIQRISTLININMNNPMISKKVLENIEEYHEEYLDLMDNDEIRNEFKNSDFIINFNNKFQEFKENLKNFNIYW